VEAVLAAIDPTRERSEIGSGDDKFPIVQDEGIFEPFCPWCCSGHHKNVANGTELRFSERVVSPFDGFEVTAADKTCDSSSIVDLYPRVRLNAPNQILGHRIGKLLRTHEEMHLHRRLGKKSRGLAG
jgi:hypothetical protein